MFWIRRFVLVFGGAWVVIVGAQLLKGHTIAYAAVQGLLWAAISATVFTGRAYFSIAPRPALRALSRHSGNVDGTSR